jgi:phospholipase/carboxylesterase
MPAVLLLTRPGLLVGAILFRPLSPFRDDLPTRLDRIPVLIIDATRTADVLRVMVLDWPSA